MQGILRDLNALATNQLFKTATQSPVVRLEEAIQQLLGVESSVSDSEFGGSVTNSTENIATGGVGYQSVNSGQGQKINSGGGEMYLVQTMNFGTKSQTR